MARFLLDEHINPSAAIQLRRKGYDAVSVHDSGHMGLGDPEVLELAAAQRRSVVTYNVIDFEALASQWFARNRSHSGIILVHERTIPQRTVGGLVRALASLADRFPGPRDLDEQVIFLTREP